MLTSPLLKTGWFPVILLSVWMFHPGAIHGAGERANIVLVMADDMGYSDIGCYGSEIRTPHLDELAQHGLRFTQFYNTSRCCPTRASLLTGLYSHQAGIGLMTEDLGYDAYRGDLNAHCVTLAEALKSGGYRNYISGKWHVTRHLAPDGPRHNWPLQRGFDRFYGTIIGAGSFFDPATLCRDNQYITPENDPVYQPDRFYYTDAITDNALAFLSDHISDHPDSPFFLYTAYTAAHWPMHALEEEMEHYSHTYQSGFEDMRNERCRRGIESGVIDSRWTLSPGAKNWASTPNQEWESRNMQVYAAMVERMDLGIGRIVQALKNRGQLDNTLFIYLQDNGGCAENMGRQSNAGTIQGLQFPPLGRDGLQTQIWPPMQTRDGRPVGTGPDVMPGAEDTYTAYGMGWANVSNTPFRGYKHDGLEGGISSPLVVHWPNEIPTTRNGQLVHDPAHLIDIMPTLLDAAGVAYPKEFKGHPISPREGLSLLPALRGARLIRTNPLGFEHHGNLALRHGDWKIASTYQRNQPRAWELYHIPTDRTELHNLAGTMPEKLQAMVHLWQTWADRVGVVEWPITPRKSN